MTVGPCPRLSGRAAQIQSITDGSRNSIRRKNPAGAASRSRPASTAEDTQEDEVAVW